MSNQNDAESLPNSIPELEKLIADYDSLLSDLDQQHRTLIASENPVEGIFHAAEIHNNRQAKNQLEVQKQFATVRLKRLQMEAQPF